MTTLDNGYISDYLIHWTGKNCDEIGFNALKSILLDRRLRLGTNPFVWLDFQTRLAGQMVCFTDVPIQHSHEHCRKFGRFGIAFEKRILANHGAHPVFYYTHSTEEDVKNIVKYLFDGNAVTAIPQEILNALRRHFYFSQPYTDKKIESHDAFYYEREWRLGEQTLDTHYGENDTFSRRMSSGQPIHYGKLVKENNNGKYLYYFSFEKAEVAFIVAPQEYEAKLKEFLAAWEMRILRFEDLVIHTESKL